MSLPTQRLKDLSDADYVWQMVMELQKLHPKDIRPPELELHVQKLVRISRRLRALTSFQKLLQGIKASKHEVV